MTYVIKSARPYGEDAVDLVLRAGEITPGTTVLVERDASGDEEDHPLKLKLIKPKKRAARKKEPAGVGGRGGSDDASAVDEAPQVDGTEPAPSDA